MYGIIKKTGKGLHLMIPRNHGYMEGDKVVMLRHTEYEERMNGTKRIVNSILRDIEDLLKLGRIRGDLRLIIRQELRRETNRIEIFKETGKIQK